MVFLVFGLLSFLIVRLSVQWRWRTVLLLSVVIGAVADALLDGWVARR
jgi:phosphatidylserine synthase